jgi:ribosomal protein S19
MTINGLKISEKMVGHKFGEFASRRKPSSFGKRATNYRLKKHVYLIKLRQAKEL